MRGMTRLGGFAVKAKLVELGREQLGRSGTFYYRKATLELADGSLVFTAHITRDSKRPHSVVIGRRDLRLISFGSFLLQKVILHHKGKECPSYRVRKALP
jgi:hypothetical protein